MSFMNLISSQFDNLIKVLKSLSILFLVISVCITFVNVLSRYLLKYPIYWADELATLLLIAVVFLPIAVIEKTGGHLQVNILFQILGDKMKVFGEYLRVLATIIIGTYITVAGFPVVYQNYKLSIKTVALEIPTALTFAVIPVAFFAVTILNVLLFLKLVFHKSYEKGSRRD